MSQIEFQFSSFVVVNKNEKIRTKMTKIICGLSLKLLNLLSLAICRRKVNKQFNSE